MAQITPIKEPHSDQLPANKEFDKIYTFRLRRHLKGNFGGLWELTMLNKMGHVIKILTDADALPYCLENLQGELENDGF